MRNEFTDHRTKMDRMRRQSRAVFGLIVLLFIITALGAAWVLAHPKLIGSYIGEVAAGYEENSK